MTIKRRDGGSGTNGAAKSPSMFEAPPANETLPEPVPAAPPPPAPAPPPPALWFVAPDDPLVARLQIVNHPFERAHCKAQYAEWACWAQMPETEAVALRMYPMLMEAAKAGRLPPAEVQEQVVQNILAHHATVAALVQAHGPTAERTVLVRVPLVQDQDGNLVPDPAVVGTGTAETGAP